MKYILTIDAGTTSVRAILYDVKIGNNVIIAAGALVNQDIPDGTIFGGVPAKQIGTFERYMQKSCEYSKKITWDDSWEFEKKKEKQKEWCWGRES